MKLTTKSMEIFNMIKAAGGRVDVAVLAEQTGRTVRSVSANVNDLVKKSLAVREKVAGKGEDAKEVSYAILTDEGMAYDPTAPAEDAE